MTIADEPVDVFPTEPGIFDRIHAGLDMEAESGPFGNASLGCIAHPHDSILVF
jgi:hypothetical protein